MIEHWKSVARGRQFPNPESGAVIGIKNRTQNGPIMGLREEDHKLVAGPHDSKKRTENMPDRTLHAAMKVRILSENGRKQRGTGTEKSRDKMKRVFGHAGVSSAM